MDQENSNLKRLNAQLLEENRKMKAKVAKMESNIKEVVCF